MTADAVELQPRRLFPGGVVGFNDPAWFVDGRRPSPARCGASLSAGFGVWGGAQPGLSRLDAGPRLSCASAARCASTLDYRQQAARQAAPGSGPVLTLAGDF
jgi:hypothetical protein